MLLHSNSICDNGHKKNKKTTHHGSIDRHKQREKKRRKKTHTKSRKDDTQSDITAIIAFNTVQTLLK